MLLASVSVFLISCTKEDNLPEQESSSSLYFYNGDVKITIQEGSQLTTKADGAEYYTVTGELNSTEYTTIVENRYETSNLVFSNHYTSDGQLIAEFVFFNDQIVSMTLDPAFEDDGDCFETKADNEPKERDGACVRRVYHDMKDTANKNHEMGCDFTAMLCNAASAVYAVVYCKDKPI